ncbi:MAG: hypothetical protein HFH20_11970, partial [Ruminococcus sp.]|nr:hypothetical protein [Ruminococcus sp.]
IKIFSPRFGGRDKKEKQKKSGNMGFKEFPRPLYLKFGGNAKKLFRFIRVRIWNISKYVLRMLLSFKLGRVQK